MIKQKTVEAQDSSLEDKKKLDKRFFFLYFCFTAGNKDLTGIRDFKKQNTYLINLYI